MTTSDIDRFAIVPVPAGTNPPANAILVGEMDILFACLPDTMANARAIEAIHDGQEQLEVRAGDLDERTLQLLKDRNAQLSQRLDAFEERCKARKQRADEEEQARIRAELDALPDPDNPDEYAPGGLTPNAPTTPEHERRLAALRREPEHANGAPDHERMADIEGDRTDLAVPPELAPEAPQTDPGTEPLESMRLKDPARYGYPADPPRATQTPASVSLNEE